jgi:hypothetical protein
MSSDVEALEASIVSPSVRRTVPGSPVIARRR